MIEVEVKARAPQGIEERLSAIGALPFAEENQTDIYFSSPYHDFKRTDQALRIRTKESGSYLTYKGPKLDPETKSRREITVSLDDPKAAVEILSSLGFLPAATVFKRRRKYRLGRITIALDDVQGLGSFIEVEASGSEDYEAEKKAVCDILHMLGISQSITQSYLELLGGG